MTGVQTCALPIWKEVKMLENHAHLLPNQVDIAAWRINMLAVNPDFPFTWFIKQIETAEQRALARTGRSDDDNLLADINMCIDIPENTAAAKIHAQTFNGYHCGATSFPEY